MHNSHRLKTYPENRNFHLDSNLLLRDDRYIINKSEFLLKLIDYSKYLYEEEIRRQDRFHNAVKTYLVFMLSTFTANLGVIKYLTINQSGFFHSNMPIRDIAIGWIFGLSLLTITISFIFLVLVIKTWKTERLCVPNEFVQSIITLTDETIALQQIMINYHVATERNSKVNDEKGKFLSLAAKWYHGGVLLMVIGGFLYVYT